MSLLFLGVVLLLAGCDLSEDDESLSLVLGSWTIQETDGLKVDGQDFTSELNARYTQVVLTFREDDNGTEFFRLRAETDNASDPVNAQGTFDLEADDRELTLFPDRGTSPAINFDFTRPSADELTLIAEEQDGEDEFLDLLFPNDGIQGDVDRVVVRLRSDQ